MSGAKLNADGRLGLMLTELRLPTMKRLAAHLCDQSDREGWPARQLLERLLEQEMNGQFVYLEPPTGATSWATSQWVVKGTNGVFNTRDFGAVGDGMTDDSGAINNAAVAANNAGGGTVYCPAATFAIQHGIQREE
ncbi:MAG: glycosyl hydrolase family 28-related protein [Candidatus Tumulicola sp.]